MYEYTDFDHAFLAARNDQFRAQVARRINGSLSEEEFRPFRLMNGIYLQLHAYMLRIAIPYGTLDAAKLRKLAEISERWDKGYGHFTTRQNIQFNWPKLSDIPDMLDALADVGLHAVQTSGATVRNVTTDPFAGAAAGEIEDPRPYAEMIRQWSTDHPEFQFLPRKFKIAIIASPDDRAVTRAHDIGLTMRRHNGHTGFEVTIGGGLGRSPMIGQVLYPFLPEADLLPTLEAILSVYNRLGRRDNKYKARLKIALHDHGIDALRDQITARLDQIRPTFKGDPRRLLRRIQGRFSVPYLRIADTEPFEKAYETDPVFRSWADTNLDAHKDPGHAIVTISLKAHGATPGDASAQQMRVIADLAETLGYNEIRSHHSQNLVLPHVHKSDLPALFAALKDAGLGTANVGRASDIIACPGMDYCTLATARSIPVAQQIATSVDEMKIEHDLGALRIKISGCINACGHHHLAHIGILGLERAGVETYQITLGGDETANARIGERTGPGFSATEIVPAVKRLLLAYLTVRESSDETFLATLNRLGTAPFKAALYPTTQPTAA